MNDFQLFDFDNFEVHGCAEVNSGGYEYTEQCDDKEATFWTVYGHYSAKSGQQGVEALVDCTDRRSAELVQKLLKVLRAGHSKSWVTNVGITNDIEALRKICLEYSDWWNTQVWRVLS
jgi:uncharacterized Ntn-hydrolase superfamily protein